MAAYLLVELDVFDPDGFAPYPPAVAPLIEKHGGKATHLIGGLEVLEGECDSNRFVVIEFPSKLEARAFIDDPDYPPIKEIRTKTAKSRMLLGEGVQIVN